jgi:hypothetical protein
MKTTDHKGCERCGTRRGSILACTFQRDGRAEFRFLCERCERVEFPVNQPALFEGMRIEAAALPLFEIEPEPVRLEAQLALF